MQKLGLLVLPEEESVFCGADARLAAIAKGSRNYFLIRHASRKWLLPYITQYIFYFLEVVICNYLREMIYDVWFRDSDTLHNFRILWFIGDNVSISVVSSCTGISNGLIGKDVRDS
jgi:hypothetical protein